MTKYCLYGINYTQNILKSMKISLSVSPKTRTFLTACALATVGSQMDCSRVRELSGRYFASKIVVALGLKKGEKDNGHKPVDDVHQLLKACEGTLLNRKVYCTNADQKYNGDNGAEAIDVETTCRDLKYKAFSVLEQYTTRGRQNALHNSNAKCLIGPPFQD